MQRFFEPTTPPPHCFSLTAKQQTPSESLYICKFKLFMQKCQATVNVFFNQASGFPLIIFHLYLPAHLKEKSIVVSSLIKSSAVSFIGC
jgi:hypothetical protein